jgi:hypothetical protein
MFEDVGILGVIEQINNLLLKSKLFIVDGLISLESPVSDDCINSLYKQYPTKCPVTGRSTGKTLKNKQKIKKIVQSGHDLGKTIIFYLDDCKKTGTMIKNFDTFLNNLPDYSDIVETQKNKTTNKKTPLPDVQPEERATAEDWQSIKKYFYGGADIE